MLKLPRLWKADKCVELEKHMLEKEGEKHPIHCILWDWTSAHTIGYFLLVFLNVVVRHLKACVFSSEASAQRVSDTLTYGKWKRNSGM